MRLPLASSPMWGFTVRICLFYFIFFSGLRKTSPQSAIDLVGLNSFTCHSEAYASPGGPIDFFFSLFGQQNDDTFHWNILSYMIFYCFVFSLIFFQATNGLAGEMIRPVCWVNPLKLFSNSTRCAISALSFCIRTICIPRMCRWVREKEGPNTYDLSKPIWARGHY